MLNPLLIIGVIFTNLLVTTPAVESNLLKNDEISLTFRVLEPVPVNVELCNLLDELRKHISSTSSWILNESAKIMNSFIFKFYTDDQNIAYLFHILQNGSLMTSSQLDRDLLCNSEGKRQLNLEEARRRLNSIMKPKIRQETLDSQGSDNFWDNSNSESRSLDDFVYICNLKFDILFAQRSPLLLNGQEIIQNMKPIKMHINLEIKDINDNSPKWISDGRMITTSNSPSSFLLTIHFKDGDPPGTSQHLPSCVDADTGRNGKISYSIHDMNSSLPFTKDNLDVDDFRLSIDPESGLVSLISKVELDRERRASYKFSILASDAGIESLTSELIVEVKLFDVNDNEPKFEEEIFSPKFPIKEDINVGTKVLQLKATDPDEGINGQIIYGFSESQSTQHDTTRLARNFFHVSTNGLITVRSRLDVDDPNLSFFETRIKNNQIEKLVRFKVQAKDSTAHPYEKISEATVSIWITDVNDEIPSIRTHILSHSNLPNVLENQSIGTFVTNIEIKDADITQNENITCRLSNSNFTLLSEDAAFDLANFQANMHPSVIKSYSRIFKLVTANLIDRDSSPGSIQNLEIFCYDRVGHEKIEKMSIQILDVNDNSPTFFKDSYNLLLEENSHLNATLVFEDRFMPSNNFAYDIDMGPNAEIEYEILESDGRSNFTVNQITGIIRSSASFDRETTENVSFTLIAKDKGHPQRSSQAKIRVEIIDLNDNNPIFSQDLYTFHVRENEQKNFFIGQVEATDLDKDYFGQFQYTMGERIGSTGAIPFNIDAKTGKLTSLRTLDREEESEYMFTVLAKDGIGYKPYIENQKLGSYTQNTGSTTVHIIIDDINDNIPEIKAYSFQDGKVINSHGTLDVNIEEPAGTQILQISVNDKDEMINADYNLKIKSGNDYEIFTLDQTSTFLILEKNIKELIGNKPDIRNVHLTLEACDNGKQPLCSIPFEIRVYFKENIPLISNDFEVNSQISTEIWSSNRQNIEKSPVIRGKSRIRSNEILIIFIIIFSILTIIAFIAFFIVWQRFQKTSNHLHFNRTNQRIRTNDENYSIGLHSNQLQNQYSTLAFGETINPKKYFQNNSFYHLQPLKQDGSTLGKNQRFNFDQTKFDKNRPRSQVSPFAMVDQQNDSKIYNQLIHERKSNYMLNNHSHPNRNTDCSNNTLFLKSYSLLNNGNYNYESLNNQNHQKFNQSLTRSKSQQINKRLITNSFDKGNVTFLQKSSNVTRSFDELTFSSLDEETEQNKIFGNKARHQTPSTFPETSFV